MKKKGVIAAACLLAFSMMAGAAYAKPDQAPGQQRKPEVGMEAKSQAGSQLEKQALKLTDKQEGKSDDAPELKSGTDADSATVTSSTYGEGQVNGHGNSGNGFKGLLNAIEHVQDKPAGAVLANLLLTKYETNLNDEQKEMLAAIHEKDAALSVVAELLDQQGSVTDAVYVQKEAIKANVKNMTSYKKLGKLLNKMGETGVKLFVNGDEPAFEVAPFIKDGSTLVPFRAIAEALKAEVSWNQEERSVTVSRDDITVKLFIGSTTAYVNGKEVRLEVAGEIVDGSTVVPVRFISESLQATVQWEDETSTVVIYEE